MFSCEFSADFQNTYLQQHIWRAPSEFKKIWKDFYIYLLNLTGRSRNEIILYITLVFKSFY